MKNYGIADCEGLQKAIDAEIAECQSKIQERPGDQTLARYNAQMEKVNSKIGQNTNQLKAAIASIIALMREAEEDLDPDRIINYLKENISTPHPALTEINYKQFVKAGLQALNQ